MAKKSCIPPNDPLVKKLMRDAKISLIDLDKVITSLTERGVALSNGSPLNIDLSNLEDLSIVDIYNELAYQEGSKSNSMLTTIGAASKMLSKLNIRLGNIKNDLDTKFKHRDTDEEREVFDRIKQRRDLIKADIKALESAMTDNQMLEITDNQLNSIEALLNKDDIDLSKDELSDIDSTLSMFKDYTLNYVPKSSLTTDLWEDGATIDVNNELEIRSKDILEKVLRLQEKFTERDRTNMIKTFKKVGSIGTDNSIFDSIIDVDYWSGKMRQLVTVDSQLAQNIALFFNTLNNKAKSYQKQLEDKLNNATASLSTSPLFQSRGYDVMFQRDEDGELTNHTVTHYSSEFEKESEEKNFIYKKDDVTKEEWKDYNAWKLKNYNTVSFVELLKEGNPDALEGALNSLKAEYGEGLGVKYFEIIKQKADEYLEAEKYYKNELSEEDFLIWEEENNPTKYIYALHNVIFDQADQVDFSNVAKYKKFMFSMPKVQNLNKNYLAIQDDVNYRLFYDYWTDLIGNYVSDMPFTYTVKNTIRKNTIPYVKKSVSDLIFKEGRLVDGFKQAHENWLGYFTVDGSEDYIYHELDNETGNHQLGVPIHFMQPITSINSEGKVVTDISKMERDLTKVAQMIIPQLAKFKYQMASVGTLEQINRIVNTIEENKGINTKGKVQTTKDGLKNLKEMVSNETKAFLGDHSDKVDRSGNISLMTADQKNLITGLEKERDDLIQKTKDDFEKKNVGQVWGESPETLSNIERIQTVYKNKIDSNSKYFSGGQTVRSLLKYYILKTLGFSPSFVFESFQSIMSVSVDAVGNENYDYKDYMNSLFNVTKFTDKKTKVLNRLFNIEGSNDFGKGTNGIEKAALYLAEQQDVLQKRALRDAMLKKKTILGLDGTEISLFDAFDNEGNWKSELFSDEVNKDWNPNSNLENEDLDYRNDFYRFLDKYQAQTIRIFGAYGENVVLGAKRSTLGKTLIMFKTWLGEAIAIRFEDKKYRADLDGYVKGRWRSVGEVVSNNGLWNTITALTLGRSQDLVYNDADLDIANIKRSLVELAILSSTFAATLATYLAIDDDEEEDNLILTVLMNLNGRMQQDILYYLNPSEASKIVGNAAPILKLYKDLEQLTSAVYSTLEGKPNYKTGDFKNWNKILKEGVEFTPGANGLLKFYKLANQDMNKYK